MVDWRSSMEQSYEYYIVDPATWKDKQRIRNVRSCSLNRDSETDTICSATIDVDDISGECYIRAYLVTIQNGITEKHPLGTVLVQTPSTSYDGRIKKVTVDAYSPLLELKEKKPPLGFSILEGSNIMENAYKIVRENLRAPVEPATCDEKLYGDFVANTDDTWLTFLIDLLANAKYEFGLDELGRVLLAPKQEISSLQPVWTYDDGNSSILYPEISLDHDIYGIPNVVEVIYSKGSDYHYARAVNDDPNSPISTVNRGREIIHRVTNPSSLGDPTNYQIQEYAEELLKSVSSIEYTVRYTHGYCPVRVGDCVRLNHPKAGLDGVKAKVVSQTIKCELGCPVAEKAVYTEKLWHQNKFTVKFELSGGEWPIDENDDSEVSIIGFSGLTKKRDDPLLIPEETPVKDGYDFGGWMERISYDIYNPGDYYIKNSSTVLYAVWNAQSTGEE